MTFLRKLLLACVASLSLMSPAIMAPKAHAQHGHTRVYWVYYRTCPHDSWHCYGGYYGVGDAQQAVRWFQFNGYDAFYR